MSGPRDGLARSVQVRLAKHAKAIGVDPNLVLTRYAVERFLYRLSRSPYAERFVLKGGLLLLVWLGETIRPTRDADLLGFGDLSDHSLMRIFAEVCSVEVEQDAMTYAADSIRLEPIRAEDAYGGRRITLQAGIGAARLRVQVDIGIGDVVTPEPRWLEYPSLLDLPRPRLRAYPPETAIAEKVHAMVSLGSRNGRMRDFFDIDAIIQRTAFESAPLIAATRATFDRRKTALPELLPLALTAAFAAVPDKRAQWQAFRTRSGATGAPETLDEVIERLAVFFSPLFASASEGALLNAIWPPGGPWIER
jgi:predicted nucleotidyltransferase component of viral defense system